jgi:hypothetical protein
MDHLPGSRFLRFDFVVFCFQCLNGGVVSLWLCAGQENAGGRRGRLNEANLCNRTTTTYWTLEVKIFSSAAEILVDQRINHSNHLATGEELWWLKSLICR